MELITVCNRKGGVSKTETCRAFGQGLMQRGYKVLFIDLDGQRNLSYSMRSGKTQYTIFDVFADKCEISDAIDHTEQGDIVGGDSRLYNLADDKKLTHEIIREKFNKLSGQYDYILIDTAPNRSKLTFAVMVASDGLLLPVMADMYAIQSLKEIYAELEGVKQYNPDIKLYGICITRYMKSVLARDVITQIKAIAEFMGTDVYTAPIRECVAVRESVAVGKSLYEYAPKSTSAKDYDAMVGEFLSRYVKAGDEG